MIGVANIFLEALFHDVKLDYHTPIISQQGEVAGRLQVELSRVQGTLPQDRISEAASDISSDSSNDEDDSSTTSTVTCRVHIKQASGLPLSLSHYVFCQYTFWNHPEPIVVPTKVPDNVQPGNGLILQKDRFKFDDCRDFTINVTEEFLEHCTGKTSMTSRKDCYLQYLVL